MKQWHWLVLALLAVAGMATIRISRSGLEKIQQHEALRLTAYKDVAGKWTIGWGHLIQPHESHLIGATITHEQATELLRQDLARMEKAVNELVKVPITGNQYDALVSFVFNVGVNNFRKSTLLRKLNAGDYQGAALEFPRWKFAGGQVQAGLLARRAAEQSLFMTA
jgi:lysozyme